MIFDDVEPKRNKGIKYFLRVRLTETGRDVIDSFDDRRTRAFYVIALEPHIDVIEMWESETENIH